MVREFANNQINQVYSEDSYKEENEMEDQFYEDPENYDNYTGLSCNQIKPSSYLPQVESRPERATSRELNQKQVLSPSEPLVTPIQPLKSVIFSDRLDSRTVLRFEACVANIVARAHQRNSPSFRGYVGGKQFIVTVDEGAELNCLDFDLARELKLAITPVSLGARAAGSQSMIIKGQTKEDFKVSTDFHSFSVIINLGRAVVVENLGSQVLCGEPAKFDHDIITYSRAGLFSVMLNGKQYVKPYAKETLSNYKVCRVAVKTALYPGESYSWKIPEDCPRNIPVFLVRKQNSNHSWFREGLYHPNEDHFIRIENISNEVATLNKHDHLGEVRFARLAEVESLKPDLPFISPLDQNVSRILTLPLHTFK